MTPAEFQSAAIKIYGRKAWRSKLARDLAIDPTTLWRLLKREQIKGPYEVAINGMLEHARRQRALEKEARRLLPRKFRKRFAGKTTKPKKKKLIPYAGAI